MNGSWKDSVPAGCAGGEPKILPSAGRMGPQALGLFSFTTRGLTFFLIPVRE
jgi:hypothetical protein